MKRKSVNKNGVKIAAVEPAAVPKEAIDEVEATKCLTSAR